MLLFHTTRLESHGFGDGAVSVCTCLAGLSLLACPAQSRYKSESSSSLQRTAGQLKKFSGVYRSHHED